MTPAEMAAVLDIAEKDPYILDEARYGLYCFHCGGKYEHPHGRHCPWLVLCEAYKP